MAKILSQYLTIPSTYFTSTNIKDRSSDVGDETVNGTNLDVTNVTITDIKNSIIETYYRLFDLWHNTKVNKYSKFGVYTRLVITNELQFITPVSTSPAPAGSFAGYNHDAIVPECTGTNWSDGGSYNETVCLGETAYFTPAFTIHLGEIDWAVLKSNISYMNVEFTNSDMSIVYATSSNFTLNTSNFTKTTTDLYLSSSKTLSSTSSLTRTYYLSYHFYDSSNNEVMYTGSNERPSFTVQYVFVPYLISDPPEINANSNFDEVTYSSLSFIVGGTTAVATYSDFKVLEQGVCQSGERIQIYVAYPDSTTWELYDCNSDYSCSGGDSMILNLTKSRVSCTTSMRVKLWPYNILDCPSTRPF